jgi:thioredoxin:protein disulfide reductase
MTTRMRFAVVVTALAAVPAAVFAQAGRPRAEVTPVVETTSVRPGDAVRVSLKIRLPEHVHVQAHEPRDPSLIPTVLTVEAPPGITVEAITYPPPTDLTQAGRRDTLAVLGPEFAIDVRLAVAGTAVVGELAVSAVLRYQACNDRVCFPPARTTTAWVLHVQK